MFWTLELASHLEDAPWPATKDELIDIKQSATNDIQRQLENKEGVYDIDAMYENVLSKLKTK